MRVMIIILMFFLFNDAATTKIYTLSLHDALPIFNRSRKARVSYKVQRTINASLNAATSTRAVSSNPNFEACVRSEERFSRNAETDLVCRLLLEKKNENDNTDDIHKYELCRIAQVD